MLNIKTEKKLKEKAQKVATELGLPLTTVINNYLREFVEERRVVFSNHPMLNIKTREELDGILKDIRDDKNLSPTFKNVADAIQYLKS